MNITTQKTQPKLPSHRVYAVIKNNGRSFFARRGEVSSNRHEDQELSMLSLHLLQNCLVYVNTLMIQTVLARPDWKGRLTARDLHALTPLFWTHVTPYGRFDIDMASRITNLV